MSILYFEGSGGEAITPIIIGWALGIISGILIQILIKNKLRLGMARAFKNEYEIDGNALREEIDLLDAAKKPCRRCRQFCITSIMGQGC